MTVIRSIGNNPGRFGALCWTQTGRTGKACILCWCTRLAVWLLFSFFSLLFRWGHLVVVDSCEEIIVGYVVSLVISYHEIHPETKKKKKINICAFYCVRLRVQPIPLLLEWQWQPISSSKEGTICSFASPSSV